MVAAIAAQTVLDPIVALVLNVGWHELPHTWRLHWVDLIDSTVTVNTARLCNDASLFNVLVTAVKRTKLTAANVKLYGCVRQRALSGRLPRKLFHIGVQ